MVELQQAGESEGLSPEAIQGRLNEALKAQPELMPFVMPVEQLVQQNAGKGTGWAWLLRCRALLLQSTSESNT